MSKKSRVLPNLLSIAVLAALPAASVWAQQAPPPAERPAPQSRSNLSDAIRNVERNTRGEVLSAERVQYDGRDMHRVKVVDNQGRVRVFMQDPARNGNPQPRPRRDNDD